MKSVIIPCECGSGTCTTTLKVMPDNEDDNNILIEIYDEKHETESWISMNKVTFSALVRMGNKLLGL